jgi:hypothetical protein
VFSLASSQFKKNKNQTINKRKSLKKTRVKPLIKEKAPI